jgi:nicotinate-nucleotide adenylyltransferase
MIGIYGGTFNPVHYGHLRTALEVKEQLALREMRLIPCRLPVHRTEPVVSADLRLAMLELAVAHTPGLCVDDRELLRSGPSFMVDTLQSIRSEQGDTPLLLVLGADAFANLESWHNWQQLLTYAHIVVMTRPGFDTVPKLHPLLQSRLIENAQLLKQQAAGWLFFQRVSLLEISASQIRHMLTTHSSAQFLLPDNVLAFIQAHQLFQALPTPPGH